MYDREAFDARRDMIARRTRTGIRPDITVRYLGVASYGLPWRPPAPAEPAQPDPAVGRLATPDTEHLTAPDAEQIIDQIVTGSDPEPKKTRVPGHRDGRLWRWRRAVLRSP